jgi:hypothetical protein
MAEIRPWMTLKTKGLIEGSWSGAFMGEAAGQSQPTPAFNTGHEG